MSVKMTLLARLPYWFAAASILVMTMPEASVALADGPVAPTYLGAAEAKIGGTLTARMSTAPKSLNYHTAGDTYGGLIARLTMPSLGWLDYESRDAVAYVAKDWKLSDDKLALTVTIDERAKWADGSPVTVEDVIYTWQTIFDTKNNTAAQRGFLDGIEIPERVDDKTLRFKFRQVHWTNLSRVIDLFLLQKSQYAKPGKNFNKDFNDVVVSGGPYVLDDKATKKNRKIVLNRNASWWGWQLPWTKGVFNFATLNFNIIQDDRVAFESLKKGDLSWYEFSSAALETWVKETNGPQFAGKPFTKLVYPKANPVSSGGIVLNMRRPPLNELKFREALQSLFNRQVFINKIFYGLHEPYRGPFGLYSPYASPKITAHAFDPSRAAALLKELGYTKADSDGVLYKEVNGKKQKAEITVLYAYQPHEKYLTVFKEDARKVGIGISLKFMEWGPMIQLADEFKFDGLIIGWSGSPEPAPEQLWLSKFADQKSSSNMAGFASAEVDALVAKAGATMDAKARYPLYHQIEELIVAQHPYIWTSGQKEHYMVYNKDKVAVPAKIAKFSGDAYRDPVFIYWWDPRVK